MALSPDGRLFLGDLTSASDATTGKIYVLDNFDEQSGEFKTQNVYLSNLRNPNSIAFYTDGGGSTWMYVALTDKLVRYKYAAGQNTPASAAQIIATLPGTPPAVANGFWHFTRTVAVHDNEIYLSIGSSCNSCEQSNAGRAIIVKMDPDGGNRQTVASGLRNAVGLTFAGSDLYATANEVDNLGDDKPDDLLYKIMPGVNYGWPYCYESGNKIYHDGSQNWKNTFDCSQVPLAWAAFAPHSAPLGLAYVGNAFGDKTLSNSFLVALHGSTNPGEGAGNAVVMSRQGQNAVDIVSGFLQNSQRLGRPVDILINNDRSFFVSDDSNGVIYYLSYQS
ncbi:MAG TPA: glucose/sorbosone dehydrogenase [Patescibacteria group bacterium]|nr:glucose/sorbosone dehydrogenase [Patescibacteria group bacterium]